MNVWDILEIEYTTDKELIKKAYRSKLSVTNPEDDQDAFIRLRRAYEEALEQADRKINFSNLFFEEDDDILDFEEVQPTDVDNEDEEGEEDGFDFLDDDYSPDEEFRKLKEIPKYWRRNENRASSKIKERLSALYNSYTKRVNPECWRELFKEELFLDVDITHDVFKELMNFVIDKYYLPKVVWKVIVDRFKIEENREKLIVNYSANIIDMMINNANYEEKNNILNESEYGNLRDNYLELLDINPYDKNARAGMMKANSALIDKYIKLLETEPNNIRAKIELARCYYYDFQYEEALELLDDMNPAREDMCDYYHIQGMVYFKMKKYELALERFLKWKNFLEGVAHHISRANYKHELNKFGYVNYLIGECYLGLKEFDKAADIIEHNLYRNHRDIVRISESKCKLYLEEGKFSLCESACKELLREVEENYVAYLCLAKLSFYTGEYQNTIYYANKAKKMCEYLPGPYHLLARFYIAMDELDNATEILEEFKKLTIYSDGVVHYEACIMYERGEYNAALETIVKLISRYNARTTDFEDFKQMLYLKADCHSKLKNYNEAITTYERILEMDPNDSVINSRIAYSYEAKAKELGNYRENMLTAVKYMEEQMKVFAYTEAIFDMGRFYEAVNQVGNAIYAYNKCLEINEKDYGGIIYESLMSLYRIVDDLENAIYCANKRIEFAESDEEKQQLYISLGCYYECKNKFESAKETYTKCEVLFGKNTAVSACYARTLYRQGNTDEAVKILEELIRSNSYDEQVKQAYMILCEIYGDVGNIKDAKKLYDFITSKNIVDCQVPASLAEVYFKNNKLEKARKYYLIARNKDKEDRYSYSVNLCELYSENTFLYANLLSQELNNINIKPSYTKYRRDLVPQIKYTRLAKRYNITRSIVKAYKRIPRCPNCPYEDCHKLLFEIGRFNEKNGHHDTAIVWFNHALNANPDNIYYKKYMENHRKKYKKGD